MEEQNIRFMRNPDFIFRKVVEETILVPVYQDLADLDSIYTLNDLGAFIWERLAQPASQTELEESILNAFDADPQTVSEDLTSFLQEMEAIGAVEKD